MLRGFLRSLKAVKEDKKDVVEFIGRKFGLDPSTAEETHKIVLQTLDRKSTRLNSSHIQKSRMPSSA